VAILLLVISGYLLMAIGGYFVNGYWWLLVLILLMVIDGYFINGYWWLLY
jgi:hypothetical protein